MSEGSEGGPASGHEGPDAKRMRVESPTSVGAADNKTAVDVAAEDKQGPSHQSEDEVKCSVCLGPIEEHSSLSNCTHVFCYGCIFRWLKQCTRCPLCKEEVRFVLHTLPDGKIERVPISVMTRQAEADRLRSVADRVPLEVESNIIRTRIRELDRQIDLLNESIGDLTQRPRPQLRRQSPRFRGAPAPYPPSNDRLRDELRVRVRDLVTERTQLQALRENIPNLTRSNVVGDPSFRHLIYEMKLERRPISRPLLESRPVPFTVQRACASADVERRRLLPWLQRELTIVHAHPGQAESNYSQVAEDIFSNTQNYAIASPQFSNAIRELGIQFPFVEKFVDEYNQFACSNLDMNSHYQNSAYGMPGANFILPGAGNGSTEVVMIESDEEEEPQVLHSNVNRSRLRRSGQGFLLEDERGELDTDEEADCDIYMHEACRLPTLPGAQRPAPLPVSPTRRGVDFARSLFEVDSPDEQREQLEEEASTAATAMNPGLLFARMGLAPFFPLLQSRTGAQTVSMQNRIHYPGEIRRTSPSHWSNNVASSSSRSLEDYQQLEQQLNGSPNVLPFDTDSKHLWEMVMKGDLSEPRLKMLCKYLMSRLGMKAVENRVDQTGNPVEVVLSDSDNDDVIVTSGSTTIGSTTPHTTGSRTPLSEFYHSEPGEASSSLIQIESPAPVPQAPAPEQQSTAATTSESSEKPNESQSGEAQTDESAQAGEKKTKRMKRSKSSKHSHSSSKKSYSKLTKRFAVAKAEKNLEDLRRIKIDLRSAKRDMEDLNAEIDREITFLTIGAEPSIHKRRTSADDERAMERLPRRSESTGSMRRTYPERHSYREGRSNGSNHREHRRAFR